MIFYHLFCYRAIKTIGILYATRLIIFFKLCRKIKIVILYNTQIPKEIHISLIKVTPKFTLGLTLNFQKSHKKQWFYLATRLVLKLFSKVGKKPLAH